MKRKYLHGDKWDWVEKSETKLFRVDDFLTGTVSIVKMHKVKKRICVNIDGNNLCLADDGYVWLAFMPDAENWCMTAMFDDHGQIIEWYYDINKQNYHNEPDNPYYDDLYLDIVLLPSGKPPSGKPHDSRVFVIDEDELREALNSGEITPADFESAYYICDKLLRSKALDPGFIGAFCEKYLTKGNR